MSGKYQAYPEYKDSGVEWLGPIPANWQVKRVKHLTQLNPSKSEVRSRSEDEHVSFIPMEAIGEQGELDASRSRPLGEVLPGYTYVADGDVMLAKITPCFENGKAAVATGLRQGIGFATTEVIPVRPNDPEDAKFFYYLLTSMPFKAVAEGSMYGAGGQKRVADSFVAEYHLAAPPLLERTQIAAFLDHETARIDRLIEKQQRLIELLKEKRQAVISHAVTKGLDPDVPMKNSGVEWLGQVPKHWLVGPVKYVLHVKKGACKAGPFGSHLTNADMNGSDVKVVTQRNVIDNDMTSGEAFISVEKYEQLKAFTIERGDLLVTTRGTIGRTSLFETDAPAILHPCLIRLQVNERILNPNWLALIIQESGYVVEQILVNSNATTIEVIYSESLLNVDVAYPPTTGEQEEALQVISQQRLRYDLLIQKALQLIDALQERRTALISAAVTGKIDVRNWQPNISTQAAEPDLPMAAEQAAEYRV